MFLFWHFLCGYLEQRTFECLANCFVSFLPSFLPRLYANERITPPPYTTPLGSNVHPPPHPPHPTPQSTP